MVAVLAPALIVAPDCVYVADGMPPSTPAPDQSVARLGEMIPAHCWARPEVGTIKTNINAREHRCSRADLMFVPISSFAPAPTNGTRNCYSSQVPKSCRSSHATGLLPSLR